MRMEPLSEDALSALYIVDQSHGRVETYQVSHLIVKVMIPHRLPRYWLQKHALRTTQRWQFSVVEMDGVHEMNETGHQVRGLNRNQMYG
jgi:hypothetical protein